MFPASFACLCKLCIINVVNTEFDLLILPFLNILQHFNCFYNVFVALLIIEILPRVLNID